MAFSVSLHAKIVCYLLITCHFTFMNDNILHKASRNFIHANYLISMLDSDILISYVESAVIRGGEFWWLGLRALYFAITLLFWFFGPIPMFGTSMAMVLLLHYLDRNTTPLHRHRSSDKGKQSLIQNANKEAFLQQKKWV
nr:uncharacterized protein LOC109158616 [Ipomoea batatas]GME21130.1 uncharacterized protein LOC109158616 [Ipomoea batatas]